MSDPRIENLPIIRSSAMLQGIIDHRNLYGPDCVRRCVDQSIEEMSELITALLHRRRNRESNVVEEVTDVAICLSLLGDHLNISEMEIHTISATKLLRLKDGKRSV